MWVHVSRQATFTRRTLGGAGVGGNNSCGGEGSGKHEESSSGCSANDDKVSTKVERLWGETQGLGTPLGERKDEGAWAERRRRAGGAKTRDDVFGTVVLGEAGAVAGTSSVCFATCKSCDASITNASSERMTEWASGGAAMRCSRWSGGEAAAIFFDGVGDARTHQAWQTASGPIMVVGGVIYWSSDGFVFLGAGHPKHC